MKEPFRFVRAACNAQPNLAREWILNMKTSFDKEMTHVALTVENHVAFVTIQNAPVNALNAATITDLSACADYVGQEDEIKAVVITGNGKCFVAGADIKEFTSAFGDKDKGKAVSVAAQTVFDKIERLRKPVIAAINGACLGGGLELALSCHMRFAAVEAKLGQPEINLGLIPGFGGTQRLARTVNKAKALELILSAEHIDGAEAERIGLVNKSMPLAELLPYAKRFAESLAAKSKLPAAAAIEAVFNGSATTIERGLELEANLWAELFVTEDMSEGVNAFIEKRKAQFKDR